MKYTFIMPAYNAGKTIEKAVRSIMGQTYNDLQIIIIDDGSKDDTLDIIRRLAKEDERIEYFHKENGGIGSAYLLAFEHVQGDYTLFVDSDDYIESNLIEKVNGAIEETTADVIQYGLTRYNVGGEKHSELLFKKRTLHGTEVILKDYLYGCRKGENFPGLSIRAMRSSIFKDFDYYSKSLSIDEVLIVHVLLRTNVLCFIEGSYYNLIRYPTSVGRSALTSEKVKGQYEGLSILPKMVKGQDKEIQMLIILKLLGFIASYLNLFERAYGKSETRNIVKKLYKEYSENVQQVAISKGLKCYIWLLRYCPYLVSIRSRNSKQ